MCVKDSEIPILRGVNHLKKMYPYGWDYMANIDHIEGLHPDKLKGQTKRRLKGLYVIIKFINKTI